MLGISCTFRALSFKKVLILFHMVMRICPLLRAFVSRLLVVMLENFTARGFFSEPLGENSRLTGSFLCGVGAV